MIRNINWIDAYKSANPQKERDMERYIECPDGYIFKDEDGNIINTTKIMLEKKGREYPTTYEECCKVIGINRHNVEIDLPQPYQQKMFNFFKLLICRDAYWKITGEEMGLGKAWEPDWKNGKQEKYSIFNFGGNIERVEYLFYTAILAFPTSEMRDIFLENFGGLIGRCKELL